MTPAEKIRKSLADNDAPLLEKVKAAALALAKDGEKLQKMLEGMVQPESLVDQTKVIVSTANNMAFAVDHMAKRYAPADPAEPQA